MRSGTRCHSKVCGGRTDHFFCKRLTSRHFANQVRDTFGLPHDATDEELEQAKRVHYANLARTTKRGACHLR